MKKILPVLLLLLGATLAWGQGGVKKKKPLPSEYGRVIISNFSRKEGMSPVVFDHWMHRSKFTCRLCHVDIGFAMSAGGTKIHAGDNMNGIYCGTCHNGKTESGSTIFSFSACAKEYSREEYKGCVRCHQLEPGASQNEAFVSFLQKMPPEKFGNSINWEQAEREGKIKLTDFIEGVSTQRAKMKIQHDTILKGKLEGMPDILFSHTKHAVWNGCELCHPDIFGIRKDGAKYTMGEIFEGKYCGACHSSVSFPLTDCRRCHSKPIGG
jgi:c(7)-type cytochrome triheme protein